MKKGPDKEIWDVLLEWFTFFVIFVVLRLHPIIITLVLPEIMLVPLRTYFFPLISEFLSTKHRKVHCLKDVDHFILKIPNISGTFIANLSSIRFICFIIKLILLMDCAVCGHFLLESP